MAKTLRDTCEESHDGRHWALTKGSILAALDAERAAGRREALDEVRAMIAARADRHNWNSQNRSCERHCRMLDEERALACWQLLDEVPCD